MTRRPDPLVRGAQLLAAVITLSLLTLFHVSGAPPLGAALLLSVVATVGLLGRSVWGIFALLATATALPFGGVPRALLVAIAAVSLGVYATSLRGLWRRDRLATLLLTAVALGTGAGSGYVARAATAPAPRPWVAPVAGVKVPAPSPAPTLPPPARTWTRTRSVHLTVSQLPKTSTLRVVFENRGKQALALDLPLPEMTYAPLLDPLLRVVAVDRAGRPLKYVHSFGCGTVYSYTKVARVVLGPGAWTSRLLELPYRHYPHGTALPSYSHGMLMNAKKLKNAPHSPAPLRSFSLRVVYDSAAARGSWRTDLHTKHSDKEQRIHGSTEPLHYVDPALSKGQAPPRLFTLGWLTR